MGPCHALVEKGIFFRGRKDGSEERGKGAAEGKKLGGHVDEGGAGGLGSPLEAP